MPPQRSYFQYLLLAPIHRRAVLAEKKATPAQGGEPGGHSKRFVELLTKAGRGNLPPLVPPPLGFEVADDLSNLKCAPEAYREATKTQPIPSRIIIDDELFDLEFTPEMSQAGREAIIRERYAIAMSNHEMVGQMLAEAETEAKQALWQLTTIQPRLNAEHEKMQRFIDEFAALTDRHDLIRKAMFIGEREAKAAWERDWNKEWIFTEEDEEEEEIMKKIAQAREAGVRFPPSPTAPIPRR